MNNLFEALMRAIKVKTGVDFIGKKYDVAALHWGESEKIYIIPPDRTRYLAEIAESSQDYSEIVE